MLRQQPRLRRDVVADRLHLLRLRDVQDQGIVLRAALCLEDPRDGGLVQPVRAETVDRLGRDAEQTAFPDNLRGSGNVFVCRFSKTDCFQFDSPVSLFFLRLLQLARLIRGDKRVDQLIQIAVHDGVDLI